MRELKPPVTEHEATTYIGRLAQPMVRIIWPELRGTTP
jgi:hypothetical protein